MKRIVLAISLFIGIIGLNMAFAADEKMQHENHHHDMNAIDMRTSLELSPEMKQHQLSNMRSHLDAVRSIVDLIADRDFDKASEIAHAKLGLTPEMQTMCSAMSNNEKFVNLAFAFHRSGDDLGDELKKKDVNLSLKALNKTMSYCMQCHASYRQ